MVDDDLKQRLVSKIDDRSFGPEDLPDYLQLFVQVCNESDDIADEVAGYDRKLAFEVDGVGDFYIKVEDGKFSSEKGKIDDPDITLTMGSNTACGIFTGEIDATSAYMGGDLKVQGPLPDAVKFRTITEMVREELEG
jgi:putative sterol carrier protein